MTENINTNIDDLHKSDGEDTAVDQGNGDQETSQERNEKPLPEFDNTDPKAMILELRKQYEELDDKYKRLWADQQNMANRYSREREDVHKYAAFSTLEVILPALDNFEFAKKGINENTSHKDILKSIDMLKEQLLMSMKSVGLSEIDTSIPFDPELHEAVSNVVDPDQKEGTIVEVLKQGYKLNDRVLRVATVVVTTKE